MKALVKIYYCMNDGEKFFGYGPCLLLREVEKTGSLRKAAINMNMAYTKALKLIKTAESALEEKLIVSNTGGKNGGGSQITKQAEVLIEEYEKFKQDVDTYAKCRFEELFKCK